MSGSSASRQAGFDDLGELATVTTRFPQATAILQQGFPELGPVELRQFARYVHLCVAREGAVLFREGDPGDFMLFVIDGMVQVLKGDPREGNTLGLVDTGKSLGEMALIDAQPRSATCVAMHDCAFAMLTEQTLAKLVAEQPRLAATIYKHLARHLSGRLRRLSEAAAQQWDPFVV
jgi:CRP/FNR family transcriptional regulator, cyclic AMP receptor protein